MSFRLLKFSFRFAEQVLNSRLAVKQELEDVIMDAGKKNIEMLTRPAFNSKLDDLFVNKGWQRQPSVFGDANDPQAKMDFLKDRIGGSRVWTFLFYRD